MWVPAVILHVASGLLNVLCANTVEEHLLLRLTTDGQTDMGPQEQQQYLWSSVAFSEESLEHVLEHRPRSEFLLINTNKTNAALHRATQHSILRNADFFDYFGICLNASLIFIIASLVVDRLALLDTFFLESAQLWRDSVVDMYSRPVTTTTGLAAL